MSEQADWGGRCTLGFPQHAASNTNSGDVRGGAKGCQTGIAWFFGGEISNADNGKVIKEQGNANASILLTLMVPGHMISTHHYIQQRVDNFMENDVPPHTQC